MDTAMMRAAAPPFSKYVPCSSREPGRDLFPSSRGNWSVEYLRLRQPRQNRKVTESVLIR